MAANTRCSVCRGLLGPEDNDGPDTQPECCARCRKRAAAEAKRTAAKQNPFAVAGRREKAMAMAAVIDANFIRQFPNLDPFDQAARIRDASRDWSDEQWADIGENALKPNGDRYPRKDISAESRDAVRDIYQGRATAPLATRNAS